MTTAFISYTHADEVLKDQFLQHLAPLRREGLISVWHDRMLNPGDHLDQKIQQELASSDLVILLVSAPFLHSEYCYEKEMQRAFARQRAGEVKVVAVIIRPCQWQNVPVGEGMTLSSFLAVPKDGKAVTRWSDPDEAFDDAAGSIRRLLLENRKTVTQPKVRVVEPHSREDATGAPTRPTRSATAPRRSDLAMFPQRVTDRDKDLFLKAAFEIAASEFEARLGDLESSDARVETDFERVDTQNFVSSVYVDGTKVGSCRIFTGAQHFGASICLSFDAASRNSMNEWLSLETSDAGIGFTASGMGGYGLKPSALLDQAAAADYLWKLFMQHVEARAR